MVKRMDRIGTWNRIENVEYDNKRLVESYSLIFLIFIFLCIIAITVPHFCRYFVNPAITFIPFNDYYFILFFPPKGKPIPICYMILLKHFILIVIIPFPENKKVTWIYEEENIKSKHRMYAWVDVSCLWNWFRFFFCFSFKCEIMCLHGDFLLFNHIFDYACTFTACQRYWYISKIR